MSLIYRDQHKLSSLMVVLTLALILVLSLIFSNRLLNKQPQVLLDGLFLRACRTLGTMRGL